MSLDFFQSDCAESSRTNEHIGLCDDDDDSKAYSSIDNNHNWIATIHNSRNKAIVFTPIDNCIEVIHSETNNKESTCDGMLTFEQTLYLVELKNQRGQWKSKAVQQLENTIKIILDNHDLSEYKYKKAFACNKKHPRFATFENERNKRFFKEYGFRIDIQAKIIIK